MKFGEKLKQCIEDSNMDMREFSARSGLTLTSLYKYTSGKSYPRIDRTIQIANVLEIPLAKLLENVEFDKIDFKCYK